MSKKRPEFGSCIVWSYALEPSATEPHSDCWQIEVFVPLLEHVCWCLKLLNFISYVGLNAELLPSVTHCSANLISVNERLQLWGLDCSSSLLNKSLGSCLLKDGLVLKPG